MTTKMIDMTIVPLKVAISVIKGIAWAEQGAVAVVIQAAVCVRTADSKAEQEGKIQVSMNWSLSGYVCLNLVSVRILTTNIRK
jgi:hypothetical protein